MPIKGRWSYRARDGQDRECRITVLDRDNEPMSPEQLLKVYGEARVADIEDGCPDCRRSLDDEVPDGLGH